MRLTTTITRASAGNINIEGNIVYRAGGTTVPVADGGTGVDSIADESLLIGNSSGALVPATLGSGLDVDANNVISVDLSTLTNTIAPTGIPFNNYVITANVAGGTTTYDWSPFPTSVSSDLGLGTPSITQVDITNSDGTGVTLPRATLTTAGVMARDDKTKLDGIEASADVNVATNLAYTDSTRVLTSSTGASVTLPVASTSVSGLIQIGTEATEALAGNTSIPSSAADVNAVANAASSMSFHTTGTGDSAVLELRLGASNTGTLLASINIRSMLSNVNIF